MPKPTAFTVEGKIDFSVVYLVKNNNLAKNSHWGDSVEMKLYNIKIIIILSDVLVYSITVFFYELCCIQIYKQ